MLMAARGGIVTTQIPVTPEDNSLVFRLNIIHTLTKQLQCVSTSANV